MLGEKEKVEPCNGCKCLRRKCEENCIFASCFPRSENAGRFQAVQQVYGASNVSKILASTPPRQRRDAADSLVYDAEMRLHDPIHGTPGIIHHLQHKIKQLQLELHHANQRLADASTMVLRQHHPRQPPFLNGNLVESVSLRLQRQSYQFMAHAPRLLQQYPNHGSVGNPISGFEGNPSLEQFPFSDVVTVAREPIEEEEEEEEKEEEEAEAEDGREEV